MINAGQAEYVLQDIAGCGRFQTLIVILVYALPKIASYFSVLFMTFGNYNPGWRCLDNVTTSTGNASRFNQSSGYTVGSCDVYKACQRVEFDPETSTIATEWELVCDNSWIASSITSIQMAGLLIGSILAGQLGDWYGRKKVLYSAFAINAVANLISVFSVSWQMYAALRFIVGICIATVFVLYFLLATEFVPIKWRAIITPIPMFSVGGIVFALTSMYLKNWRQLELACVFWCVLSFLPVFYVPESLRWLEVKNRTAEFMHVSQKIIRINKKSPQRLENINFVQSQEESTKGKAHKYTVLDLFRRGYRQYSVIIGVQWMAFSLTYYGIYLGARNLYGDFYINQILLNVIDIPVAILPMLVPNIVGRVKSCFVFLAMGTIAFVISTIFLLWAEDRVMEMGTLVLTLVSKSCINCTWYISTIHIAEIYPTTVRCISLGWGGFMARIGAIAAPFLFSDDPDTLYVCYIVMGVASFVCAVAVTRFPETKGKLLKKTLEDKDKRSSKGDDASCESSI